MPYQSFQAPDQGLHSGIILPHGLRIYAIGDIHGQFSLLDRLQEMIRKDVRDDPAIRHVIIYLGDYVDRGPKSSDVIDRLCMPSDQGIETIYLKGNHEEFLINFLEDASTGDAWLLNGGGDTLASYGVPEKLYQSTKTYHDARDALRHRMPAKHRDFLNNLALSHRIGSLFFAHAGVNPDVPLDQQRSKDLMWIRHKFINSTKDIGAYVIHGHTPRPEPEVTPFRINVDTHAWHTGHLTAVVLESGKFRFLNT